LQQSGKGAVVEKLTIGKEVITNTACRTTADSTSGTALASGNTSSIASAGPDEQE
tara:strand:+ start:324 stop:488 length:165 start_codon:yes stop_codon:yes gene_type:complete